MSEFVSGAEADMEDLFEAGFYCGLVAGAFASDFPKGLKVGDLKSKAPRITARVEEHFKEKGIAGGRLNHYRPSAYFLREQGSQLDKLNDATLERASKMFARVNECIE